MARAPRLLAAISLIALPPLAGFGAPAHAQGGWTRYDGPVAICRSKPGIPVGGIIISACSGQECWEDGSWICHMRPEDRPDLKAKADAKRAIANAAAAKAAKAEADRRKAVIDAEVLRLGGEHRRAEAERIVAMRENAEAARRRSLPSEPPPAPISAPPIALPQPEHLCTFPATKSVMSSDYFFTRAEAAANLRKRLANRCTGTRTYAPPRAGTIVGAIQCRALPTLRYANGQQEANVECQASYTCPAYQASCGAPHGTTSKSAAPR